MNRHPADRLVWPLCTPLALKNEPGTTGRALTATRVRLGLSMRALAAEVGRSVWWVHAVEHGRLKPQAKQARTLGRLARRAARVSY